MLGGHETGDNDGQAWSTTAFNSKSVWGGEPLLLPRAYEGELRRIYWQERGRAESDGGFGEGNVQSDGVCSNRSRVWGGIRRVEIVQARAGTLGGG